MRIDAASRIEIVVRMAEKPLLGNASRLLGSNSQCGSNCGPGSVGIRAGDVRCGDSAGRDAGAPRKHSLVAATELNSRLTRRG